MRSFVYLCIICVFTSAYMAVADAGQVSATVECVRLHTISALQDTAGAGVGLSARLEGVPDLSGMGDGDFLAALKTGALEDVLVATLRKNDTTVYAYVLSQILARINQHENPALFCRLFMRAYHEYAFSRLMQRSPKYPEALNDMHQQIIQAVSQECFEALIENHWSLSRLFFAPSGKGKEVVVNRKLVRVCFVLPWTDSAKSVSSQTALKAFNHADAMYPREEHGYQWDISYFSKAMLPWDKKYGVGTDVYEKDIIPFGIKAEKVVGMEEDLIAFGDSFHVESLQGRRDARNAFYAHVHVQGKEKDFLEEMYVSVVRELFAEVVRMSWERRDGLEYVPVLSYVPNFVWTDIDNKFWVQVLHDVFDVLGNGYTRGISPDSKKRLYQELFFVLQQTHFVSMLESMFVVMQDETFQDQAYADEVRYVVHDFMMLLTSVIRNDGILAKDEAWRFFETIFFGKNGEAFLVLIDGDVRVAALVKELFRHVVCESVHKDMYVQYLVQCVSRRAADDPHAVCEKKNAEFIIDVIGDEVMGGKASVAGYVDLFMIEPIWRAVGMGPGIGRSAGDGGVDVERWLAEYRHDIARFAHDFYTDRDMSYVYAPVLSNVLDGMNRDVSAFTDVVGREQRTEDCYARIRDALEQYVVWYSDVFGEVEPSGECLADQLLDQFDMAWEQWLRREVRKACIKRVLYDYVRSCVNDDVDGALDDTAELCADMDFKEALLFMGEMKTLPFFKSSIDTMSALGKGLSRDAYRECVSKMKALCFSDHGYDHVLMEYVVDIFQTPLFSAYCRDICIFDVIYEYVRVVCTHNDADEAEMMLRNLADMGNSQFFQKILHDERVFVRYFEDIASAFSVSFVDELDSMTGFFQCKEVQALIKDYDDAQWVILYFASLTQVHGKNMKRIVEKYEELLAGFRSFFIKDAVGTVDELFSPLWFRGHVSVAERIMCMTVIFDRLKSLRETGYIQDYGDLVSVLKWFSDLYTRVENSVVDIPDVASDDFFEVFHYRLQEIDSVFVAEAAGLERQESEKIVRDDSFVNLKSA